ncbi:mannosyltransferase, partial [Linderina pennispora]
MKKSRESTPSAPDLRGKRVALLVLGDIGRSPRMQYHAISLAKSGMHVDFVGYDGARPMEDVVQSPRIALRHIKVPPPLPASAPRAAFYLYAPVKIVYQVIALFWMLLFTIQRPEFIVVQVNWKKAYEVAPEGIAVETN